MERQARRRLHPPLQGEVQRATFAANRAVGRVCLAVAATPFGTRRTTTREEGSLRVRFPKACAGAPEAVLVNTAGGIAGGDRFAVDLGLDAGAQLTVTTAAAEKIYRSLGPDACVDVSATVKDGATLTWLPQETILFDRARLARTITIALAPRDRKSTRLNSIHGYISYAVFCLKKKKNIKQLNNYIHKYQLNSEHNH